jgi:2-dehydro-3-deoxygluconokinase
MRGTVTLPSASERKFVCAGETLAMFVPKPGPLAGGFSHDYQLTAAGAETNVATYLSRLGNSVDWVSRVGSDHAGSFILSYLESEGVGTKDVEVDYDAPTAVAVKEPSRDGSTVRYYRRGSAASKLGPKHVDTILGLSATFVHLTGITAALSDTAMEFTEKALTVLPERALVSFDVNLRPTLWEKAPAETLLRFALLSETAFVGLDEAGALWGCDTPNQVRDLIPRPATLVVKQGPIGATVFRGKNGTFVPSLEVDVVEPIGAGDAFAAGFLHSHRRGESPRSAARFGTVLACASLSSHKDIGDMPSSAYIRSILQVPDGTWAETRYSS